MDILPVSKSWKVSYPTHTYTVETSWYSQPPREIPFSGEAAAPGSLKIREQVKFTSDSWVPRSCQPKCPSCSETGPSVCPAMTSCKLWPLNERESITCQKLSCFMWALQMSPLCSIIKVSMWTVGEWSRGTVLDMNFYSCSKLQPSNKVLPNNKVRFFISHFIRHLIDMLVS